MKRNPRKVKWTKAYRRLHGKDMTKVNFLHLFVEQIEFCKYKLLIVSVFLIVVSFVLSRTLLLNLRGGVIGRINMTGMSLKIH